MERQTKNTLSSNNSQRQVLQRKLTIFSFEEKKKFLFKKSQIYMETNIQWYSICTIELAYMISQDIYYKAFWVSLLLVKVLNSNLKPG